MSFVSGAFLMFLPVTAAAFWLCPAKQRWIVLLLASLIFCLGWDISCELLLLAEITAAWASCLIVEKHKDKRLFALLLIVLFLPLAGYKYSRFVVETAASIFDLKAADPVLSTYALPVGISFYTFQAVSCVIDVYRGEEKAERNWFRFALFVSFFPQLVAGPIERAGTLLPQLKAERHFSYEELCAGMRLVLTGFFQKVCAADSLAPVVDRIFAQSAPDGSIAVLGAALFAFQIYSDFAGYAAIAMGCARMLGIRLTRNFRSPYLADGLRDFWRRWHITLNQWFQLYMYRPLGGSKHGLTRKLLASCAVFLLSGLWHGADWTFVCWGAFHAVCYAIETIAARRFRLPKALSIVMTFAAVTLSWVLFRAESMAQAAVMYRAMFSPWQIRAAWLSLELTWPQVMLLIIIVAAAMRLERWAFAERLHADTWSMTVGVAVLLTVILCWLAHLGTSAQNAFIYFQF